MKNMTMTNTMVKLLVLIFFSIWKLMMEGILFFKDFHGPINGDSAKPSNMPNKSGTRCIEKPLVY